MGDGKMSELEYYLTLKRREIFIAEQGDDFAYTSGKMDRLRKEEAAIVAELKRDTAK